MTDTGATNPLVSVVVPCLNRARFLPPTIESILGQDYPEIECVVVDGGSSDESIEILKGYGDKIKWVSEPDKNQADAINKGWGMCKGEILAWLNADDLWAVPDAVGKAVEFLNANPDVDVVYGDCGRIDIQGNPIGMTYLREWDLEYAVINCDHCIPQPASFIRRSALERVGWLDTSFCQKPDHELWLRIALTGRIIHIPVIVAHERELVGLSQDGKTVAPTCIQLTKKFFTLEGVPPALMVKERRALSNSYLQGMEYAFQGGRLWHIILSYALRSALVDPTNTVRPIRRLGGIIVRTIIQKR